MKQLLLIAAIVCMFNESYSQLKVYPENKIETGFLYNLSYQLSGMEKFDGSKDAELVSRYKWHRIYHELTLSNRSGQMFRPLSEIKQQAGNYARKGIIPIGLLHFRYNYLSENSILNHHIDGELDIAEIDLEEKTLFAASALSAVTRNGSNVRFYLGAEFYYSNRGTENNILRIDFGNGEGMKTLNFGEEILVNYATTGKKIIEIEMLDETGMKHFSKFELDVAALETPAPDVTWSVAADIGYEGVITSGDVYILYGNGNTQLSNPVVISEGIDFEDENNWEAIYELLNQQNLLENLRSEGFDVLVLNFDDAVAYIQSNAFLLMKVIEMVNDSIDYSENIIVVGPSMGGLVTRYALTYMENNGMNHNCNLWFSFEAPHQGANLPLGLQYELLFFKDLDANIQLLLDALNEPAPRQMLVYHYTDPPSSPAAPDNLFQIFQDELAEIGNYPQIPRIVGLSNGRGDATGQPYSPGEQVISYNYNSFLVNIKGNVWAVQNNTSGQIFQGLIQPLFGGSDQLNVTVFSQKPYDNSPGGISPTFGEIAELEAPFGDIIALHDNHSFIPTVSGLDISTENIFFDLENAPDIMLLTPFDTIFWAADNFDHKYISPQLAAFIMDEILTSRIKTQQIALTQGWNDLSLFIEPTQKNVQDITAQLGDDLIIMQHFNEIFWPSQGINLIGEWNTNKGYLVKLNTAKNLIVEGTNPDSRTLTISAGWNLIPVLGAQTVEIELLFGDNLQFVQIIKDGIGLNVFWPDAGIQTLQFLHPGNAYYLFSNEDFQIEFEN